MIGSDSQRGRERVTYRDASQLKTELKGGEGGKIESQEENRGNRIMNQIMNKCSDRSIKVYLPPL